MDPSLITRPLECVPRTPWCILPLSFTTYECIYLSTYLPTYRHTHTHAAIYSAVIFRVILTGEHVVVFRTIIELGTYSSCKLRNQIYDIDYDLYNCSIIVFFRYVKRRRTYRERKSI